MQRTWPKAILFGDSLTQYGYSSDGCWVSLLSDFLQRKCDVINRGFSGYNTRWCKIILPKLVIKEDVKDICFITIFLGANDSVDSEICPKQHVPVPEFKQNLTDMVTYLLNIGLERQKIIIISPPTCDDEKWKADCKLKDRPYGKFNEPTKEYARVCMEVAKETGAAGIDLYTAMEEKKEWSHMLNDGLHLSPEGSSHLFDILKPHVSHLTSDLTVKLPYWDDIDNNAPNAILDNY